MLLRFSLLWCMLFSIFSMQIVYANETKLSTSPVPIIDLSNVKWGLGESYRLDGLWHAYWEKLYTPAEIEAVSIPPIEFPVPAAWGDKSDA